MSFVVAAICSVVNEFSCKFFFLFACFMLNFGSCVWRLSVPLHKCQRLSFHDILSHIRKKNREKREFAQRTKEIDCVEFAWNEREYGVLSVLSSMKRFLPFFAQSSRINCYKYCFMRRKESKSEMVTKRERAKRGRRNEKSTLECQPKRQIDKMGMKRARTKKANTFQIFGIYKELNVKLR